MVKQEKTRLEQDLRVKEEELKLQFQKDLADEQDKLQKLLEQYVTDYRTNEGKVTVMIDLDVTGFCFSWLLVISILGPI